MSAEKVQASDELRRSFASYDQQVTIDNIQLGCILGILLMPAGLVLDYFMYPDRLGEFFRLRLLCSALIGAFWALVRSPVGRKFYRQLGVLLAMFPASFITIMIHLTEGAASPYYAGLNLVLLVVGYVLHWTLVESLAACGLVIAMYVAACTLNPIPLATGIFFNNLYFLFLTGVIVVAGSYHHSKLRFSDFALRFELDKNRARLEETNRQLKELDEIKSRFFANISHELRTPLTLLIAPLEALISQKKSSFSAEVSELLQTMHANGMRLLKLINDLLDLVRLDAGKMEVRLERLEVDGFVKGILQSVKTVATDKQVRLEAMVDPAVGTVLADRDKWEKILLNLVFNAIKFTPARGKVEVHANRDGDLLVLEVIDTGMGISEENLKNVFGRFWQGDTSAQRKYQGAGIGLALVKELVEVQNGQVSIQSELQKGTRITIRLPYRSGAGVEVLPSTEIPAEVPVSPEQNEWLTQLYRRAQLFPSVNLVKDAMRPIELPGRNGQHSVLIADDEPDMLRFLKQQLSAHYQVLEAVDGAQAVEKAAQFLPDAVLLDMMMPEKDGLQVCRELKARTPTRRIPVILLTARADEQTKLAALEAGASDFLAKPFSTTELHVRVKNLVENYEFQRKLTRQNQILEETIQQLKETELQLVQSEKLASLGRMSAGIIHEINNPLNFAKTALHLVKKRTARAPTGDDPEVIEEALTDIGDGIERVRRIVTDLRAFTHPNTSQFEEVSLRDVVEASLRFCAADWREKVQIEQKWEGTEVVRGNRHQLVQVVLNLLQNSLDALKKKQFPTGQASVLINGMRREDLFLLTIRDNGPGITAEALPRIFDPFFTTKDVGEGMGLGLSICYKIMEAHEGRITVNSEEGQFCEFTLEFPLNMTEFAT